MNRPNIYGLFLLFALFVGCGGEEGKGDATQDSVAVSDVQTTLAGPTSQELSASERREIPAYRLQEDFIKWYEKAEIPRKIDLNQDVSTLTYPECYFLKWEIMGQNGFMYIDEILRDKLAYDDAYNYQPVFWDDDFEVNLLPEEVDFISQLDLRMKALSKSYFSPGSNPMVDLNQVVNRYQFPDELLAHLDPLLAQNGFAILPAKNEQLFHLYDRNNYENTPSFVTTDLYLQVFHMFFQYLIKDLEETHFMGELEQLLAEMIKWNNKYAGSDVAEVKAAAEFNLMYFGLAQELLTGKKPTIPARLQADYAKELKKILAAEGQGSDFLKFRFFDYSLFKPRGHYTRTERLGKYFRAMMWLQTGPLTEEYPEAFNAGLLGGWLLASPESGPALNKRYNRIFEPLRFIAGEPNKLAAVHVRDLFKKGSWGNSPEEFLVGERRGELVEGVRDVFIPGFSSKTANEATSAEMKKLRLVFFPQRYTLDGEILSRMVEVERKNLQQEPMRAVPKGLDVFAAFGNAEAENILNETYQIAKSWPAFPDTLRKVQQKFTQFQDWEATVYNKWMLGLKKLNASAKGEAVCMQTEAWKRKDLNTALASWAELKHDMILYADQPNAAQMGAGGEWPEPVLKGYVEPKIAFWANCEELLDLTQKVLNQFDLNTSGTDNKIEGLKEVASRFLSISRQELARQPLTSADHDYIRFIGGEMENLTLRVMDSDASFWYEVTGPDKFMAIIADVYSYQGFTKKVALEEGVGFGDEIFAVVEIEGKLYLTRGAVFSYHEFEQPIDERLTDEEWQKMLKEGNSKGSPVWMKGIRTEYLDYNQ